MSVNSENFDASEERVSGRLLELKVASVQANESNPRLDFPVDEMQRLTQSIKEEGVLVPIVVYAENDKYVLVDGERRFRCARELSLEHIPALVTEKRRERDVLQQMFNIHLIREPWRDIPTALALKRLSEEIFNDDGKEPEDGDLAELTGLSVERVRQLRYVVTLPEEWQDYVRFGRIPLNFFWELKRSVVDVLKKRRKGLFDEYGEEKVLKAFVNKRLEGTISDVVSLRNVTPIIKFAEREAEQNSEGTSQLDDKIRELIENPSLKIDDVYQDTVQLMIEVNKLDKSTKTMVDVFDRLLRKTEGTEDYEQVCASARNLVEQISALIPAY